MSKKFSERIGKSPIKSVIQRDGMDSDLKNSLWNALNIYYLQNLSGALNLREEPIQYLFNSLWLHYFKNRLDEIPYYVDGYIDYLKRYFFGSEWFLIYDLIEIIPVYYKDESYRYDDRNEKYISACNLILENELSAYRFVDGKIIEITSSEEIQSIENALEASQSYLPINSHLNQSVNLLADRRNPDYRNSIKESISAVEALCRFLAKDPYATLGQALKIIEAKHNLHQGLKKAFSILYGYTSDADGIRHALLEEDKLEQEDAIFMLVVCSAFINYMLKKYTTIE